MQNEMIHPDEKAFDAMWAGAGERMDAFRAQEAEQETRIELWRAQEYHNWLRWRICRKGFDWSKPGVIGLLALGFGALIVYGMQTSNWFVTAGGIVVWFTAVNLSFFTYFGLTLPGPPLALPKPVRPNEKYRAEMGVYPAGYERRKFSRVWIRVQSTDGEPHRFELALHTLPGHIQKLVAAQTTWRMQRGDAPLTLAVFETETFTRREIDAGEIPIKVVAWKWNPTGLIGFDRKK
ncbi:MAG: hypothetical protein WCT04_05050 [Planctomycetota bacterium]